MELSTKVLIEEAKKLNYKVEIIDELDNIIKISNNNKFEYIKQATKTSKDNYVSVMLMENKFVTNKILLENNINAPSSKQITKDSNINELFEQYHNKKIVIKPCNTNFGIGITLFKESFDKKEFTNAITYALKFDKVILIENFFEGEEYRFIVVNNEVLGILNREPANVVGNGINSIKELVNEKNKSELRGTNYEKPLEKIKLENTEKEYLLKQNLTIESILKNNQKIYLRKNSNISTGGDSIDYTDDIIDYYKEIALKATKTLNVNICGIDMMIKNIKEEDEYGIIELNFNPAIHIHHHPFKGKSRNVAKKILDTLFK